MEKIRIAKYLASKNLCSRRDAERHIINGDVTVNCFKINSPLTFVNDFDDISFCGQNINHESKQIKLWLYYKPVGEITTHKDPQGRKTVFHSVFQKGLPRVISVGRLDINSEGLLLLTNDNALAFSLEKPHQNLKRVYRVRVFGSLNQKILSNYAEFYDERQKSFILRNIMIKGVHYAPFELEFEKDLKEIIRLKNHNFRCTITLTEGKNREIRKIMNNLGVQVNRLIRIQYGPFYLGPLKSGNLQEVENFSQLIKRHFL